MPAYINIQCFKKCNKDEFDYFLEKFKFVLRNLNFDESYFASYIDRITWKLSDNGFMYSGCNMPSQQIKFYNEYLSVRPLIMGHDSENNEGWTDAWVEFAILLTEDEVFKDYVTCEMHNSAKRAICFLSEQLSSCFPNAMVYVTDEATDARPWEALLGLNGDK